MNFIDLFSGIGGFRYGLEAANHKCLGFCDFDDKVRDTYKKLHNTAGEYEWKDVRDIKGDILDKLVGKVDIICGGFPCQTFSVAGKRSGFNDIRGTMFFEIARIAKRVKPKILLLENVEGILNHNKGETFRTILCVLDELGYDAEWQLCDSQNYGMAQKRKRVFLIGYLRGQRRGKVFPLKQRSGVISGTTAGNIKLPRSSYHVAIKQATKQGYDTAREGDSINFTHPKSKTRRGRVGKGKANTLDTQCNQGVIDNGRLRRLTPRECWLAQGFPEKDFDKIKDLHVDRILYKQIGNSIPLNVVKEIAMSL